MIKLPRQLQNPEFRFFLVSDSKKPIELSWNKDNCYPFFHTKLKYHDGNIGIVTGKGRLIVLDFDDRKFYEHIVDRLPPTFTVLSAGKKLPHMYYYLKGEMIKKKAILGKSGKTLMDIQANNNGIIAPGSCINNKYYVVANDKPISEITLEQLEDIFNFKSRKPVEEYTLNENATYLEKLAHVMFRLLGIERTTLEHFKCPLHESEGKANLSILKGGRIYCFHETKSWSNALYFTKTVMRYQNNYKLYKTVEVIEYENRNSK
jgi:hypothetical protein